MSSEISDYDRVVSEHILPNLERDNLEHNAQVLVKHQLHKAPIDNPAFSPLDYQTIISRIGANEPSTALAFGMHLYTLYGLNSCQPDRIPKIYEAVRNTNEILSSLNDPGLYFTKIDDLSIDRFSVTAERTPGGFLVNGTKPFVSLSQIARFLPVYALCKAPDNRNRIIALVVDKNQQGVEDIDDWNSISMEATNSNSISFDNVEVPGSYVLSDIEDDIDDLNTQGYFFRFHICSVYHGIAHAAFNLAKEQLSQAPKNIASTLKNLPHAQSLMGDMLAQLNVIDAVMLDFRQSIEAVVSGDFNENKTNSKTIAFKDYVTFSAEEVVRKAMELVGIRSLTRENHLSRLYLDVKAGRFHPPQRQIAYEILAKRELGIDLTANPRWGG